MKINRRNGCMARNGYTAGWFERQGIGTPRSIGIPKHGPVLWIAYTAGTAIRQIVQCWWQSVAHSTLALTSLINEHHTAPKYTSVKIS